MLIGRHLSNSGLSNFYYVPASHVSYRAKKIPPKTIEHRFAYQEVDLEDSSCALCRVGSEVPVHAKIEFDCHFGGDFKSGFRGSCSLLAGTGFVYGALLAVWIGTVRI